MPIPDRHTTIDSTMDHTVTGEFVEIARTADVREKHPVVREINGHEVALFRVGDHFYAVSNVCPHQHSPVIAEGPLEEYVITCPMHGWRYDIRTGRSVSASGSLRTYELRVVRDGLQIRVPEPPAELPW